MDDLYRDYILEHYRRPHNFGVLEEPPPRYEGANPLCGDRITMMSASATASWPTCVHGPRLCDQPGQASLLTDEVKGKPVDEVAKLTSQDVLDLIGIEISPARLKCALLSLDTLEHALAEADGKPDASPATEWSLLIR